MTLTADQLRSLRAEAERGLPPPCAQFVALVEEVERLRRDLNRIHSKGAMHYFRHQAQKSIAALAAKAEAGKGLRRYVMHDADCAFELTGERCDCGYGPALARWEAANAE